MRGIGFVFHDLILRRGFALASWVRQRTDHWRFFPEEEVKATRRRYRGDSLILETEIENQKAAPCALIDFMPPAWRESGHHPHRGRVGAARLPMQMELIIRFDYGPDRSVGAEA